MLSVLLLWLLLPGPSVRPDPTLTPGAIRPLSLKVVCETRWGLDQRMVSGKMKRQVMLRYGIPWADRASVEIDHLIPRELAGADVVINLSPEPWSIIVDGRQMGAHQKDRAENATHKAVCDGRILLADAQRGMASDWTVLYRRFVGDFPLAK